MKKINGYNLSRQWLDFTFENPDKINCTHTALYFYIIDRWNRFGQKEKFGLPAIYTMEALNIKSRKTYYKVFNDLIEFKFIKIVQKSKNQNTANVISLGEKIHKQGYSEDTSGGTAHDQAMTQAGVTYINNITIEQYNNIKEENKKLKKENSLLKKQITKENIQKKKKYGKFKNVLLSEKDIEKLKERFNNFEEKIKELDEGIELKGYKYKNHYLAILKWNKEEIKNKPKISNEMKKRLSIANKK